jgi:kinetochore protein NDC80
MFSVFFFLFFVFLDSYHALEFWGPASDDYCINLSLSSTRRGSIWGGATGLAAASSQTVKDTRPLRDRPYQMKMRQDIYNWLQSTGYDISMQTLVNITGKDFRSIFHHLVELIDPWHPFDPTIRFEDEFLPALKALRYPFAAQIDSKWLAAPASMHSWPFLLGMLHWLVEMGKVCTSP